MNRLHLLSPRSVASPVSTDSLKKVKHVGTKEVERRLLIRSSLDRVDGEHDIILMAVG